MQTSLATADVPNVHSADAQVANTRDRAVDVLRGWAIVMMIVNHVGPNARLTMLVNFPLWLSPVSLFVLLSGYVLGLRSRSAFSPRGIWKRARTLWIVHCAVMAVVLVVHEWTGRLRGPSVAEAGGVRAVLWKVPALRLQAEELMNILPLFIVFFLIAPPALKMMRAGKTGVVVALSFALWAAVQIWPSELSYLDPASGRDVFMPAAFQWAFILGVVAGYHRSELSRMPLGARRFSIVVIGIVALALFVLAQAQRSIFASLGAQVPPRLAWLVELSTWAPARAAYACVLLVLAHVGVRRALAAHVPFEHVFAPIELMGRRSLYCFLVHLPLAVLSSFFGATSRRGISMDVAAAASVAIVYAMARFQILSRYIPN